MSGNNNPGQQVQQRVKNNPYDINNTTVQERSQLYYLATKYDSNIAIRQCLSRRPQIKCTNDTDCLQYILSYCNLQDQSNVQTICKKSTNVSGTCHFEFKN